MCKSCVVKISCGAIDLFAPYDENGLICTVQKCLRLVRANL